MIVKIFCPNERRVGESASRKSVSVPGDPKGQQKQGIDYSTRLATRPVSATVSGVRQPDSEASDSTMGSVHLFGRPASATGLNADRALPKSALASMPNQSTNPVLLNYLSTKLANLKETRLQKAEFKVGGQGKHALAKHDNGEVASLASGVTSETDLNATSDAFLVDPDPASSKVPAVEVKSDFLRTAGTTSTASTSYQSLEFTASAGARINDDLAAQADGRLEELKEQKMAELNEMRVGSNPEIKFTPAPVKLSKQMKKDSKASRRKSNWLKGVPEDEQEQSRTSKLSPVSPANLSPHCRFNIFRSVSGSAPSYLRDNYLPLPVYDVA